jgi:hypothetical protein
MRLDFLGINKLLSDKIQSGEPFSCLRIDNTSGYVLDCMYKGVMPSQSFYNYNTLLEGGVYPTNMEYAFSVVQVESFKMLEKADILGFVDMSGEIKNGPFSKHFESKDIFFNPEFYVMDPGALLGHAEKHFGIPKPELPWTHFLKGKKVLVISTHVESIKQQWKIIDKVWGDKRDLIAPYELVDVIRSPYHPEMDSRQPENCETWLDSVDFIKKQIETYDYDVLLAGCTTSAPFYVQHAKENGKIGIQTGGAIQLHYGIYGYRWTNVPGHSEWHNMFNEHWTYPLKVDEAANRSRFPQLETNFAYWRT